MGTRRLYYDDAFERDFSARVLSCEPALARATTGVAAEAWEVTLDQTAFYPSSGGQPHDTGCLDQINVIEVFDEGDEIIHLVDQPVRNGAVTGRINWPRRFDYMQQHSGQHLLSAMFLDRFALPTVSFHMGTGLCTIDLRGPEPTDDKLEGAERACNEIIFEDRDVNVRYGTAEEFAELGVRKEVNRSGILRAIEIEGADLQPCGGTHVRRTGQIGIVLVRGRAKVRNDWRVEFVCGRRAERFARNDFHTVRSAAAALRCSSEELVSAVQRSEVEREAQFKKVRALTSRLALAEAGAALSIAQPRANGLQVIASVLPDATAEYLSAFATQIVKSQSAVVLLGESHSGQLVFSKHPSCSWDMSGLLNQVFERFPGKGGGTGSAARGRLSDATQTQAAIDYAAQQIDKP